MCYKHGVLVLLVLTSSRGWRHGHSGSRARRLPDTEFQTIPNFEPEIPEHCQNKGICDDVPNYPQQYIDYLLRNNATVRTLLSFMASGYESAIDCPGDHKPYEDNLCASRIEVAHPKAGRDANGRWHYLAAEYHLCVELCTNPDKPCSKNHIKVSKGYEATCRQKYITKRMTVLDQSGAVKHIDVPLIASGCCCHIEFKEYV